MPRQQNAGLRREPHAPGGSSSAASCHVHCSRPPRKRSNFSSTRPMRIPPCTSFTLANTRTAPHGLHRPSASLWQESRRWPVEALSSHVNRRYRCNDSRNHQHPESSPPRPTPVAENNACRDEEGLRASGTGSRHGVCRTCACDDSRKSLADRNMRYSRKNMSRCRAGHTRCRSRSKI